MNAAGLPAARSTVQTFGEERAIVVERYDRRLLDRKLKLAMKIGGEYRLASIRGRHWRRLSGYAGLDEDETIDRIDRLCREIPTHLAEAADDLRPVVKASDMPDHLVRTVTSWAADCRSALGH